MTVSAKENMEGKGYLIDWVEILNNNFYCRRPRKDFRVDTHHEEWGPPEWPGSLVV